MSDLLFSKVRNVKSPQRANDFDAGIDFFIPNDFNEITLNHGESILIPSGIKVNIPHGFALIAFNKSGVASKKNLDIMASVVDETYMGEIHINIINNGKEPQSLKANDKIIQFILLPVSYLNPIEVSITDLYINKNSSRGTGGFGSSGV